MQLPDTPQVSSSISYIQLIDALLSIVSSTVGTTDETETIVPFRIEQFRFYQRPQTLNAVGSTLKLTQMKPAILIL
jgi:hypothetical protein